MVESLDILYSSHHTLPSWSLKTLGYLYGNEGYGQSLSLGPILGQIYNPTNYGQIDSIVIEQSGCAATIIQTNPDPRNNISIMTPDPNKWSKTHGYSSAFSTITNWLDSIFVALGPYPTDDGIRNVVGEILKTVDGTVLYHNQCTASQEVKYLAIQEQYELFQKRIRFYLGIKVLNNATTIKGNNAGFYNFYQTFKQDIKPESIIVSFHGNNLVVEYENKMNELGVIWKKLASNTYIFNNQEDLNLLKLAIEKTEIVDFPIGERVKLIRELGLE